MLIRKTVNGWIWNITDAIGVFYDGECAVIGEADTDDEAAEIGGRLVREARKIVREYELLQGEANLDAVSEEGEEDE